MIWVELPNKSMMLVTIHHVVPPELRHLPESYVYPHCGGVPMKSKGQILAEKITLAEKKLSQLTMELQDLQSSCACDGAKQVRSYRLTEDGNIELVARCPECLTERVTR
jgi:hypothetical protein